MMCEDCGIRNATFHLMTIINGEKVERNLCHVCMAKHQKQIPGIDFSNIAGILNSILENKVGQDKKEIDPEIAQITCGQCGMTYGEFQKCGMLGCANCYKAFKVPMSALLQRLHGNTQHAGRIPDGAHSGVSIRINIDRLKQKLQACIADEEYEQAAKIRDAIRALNIQLERQKEGSRVRPPEPLENREEGEGDA